LVQPGVVEVNKTIATRTPPRFLNQDSSTRLRDAPQAVQIVNGNIRPIYTAGDRVRLIAKVPASQTWEILFRKSGRNQTYMELGTAISTEQGRVALPVMRIYRKGLYIFALRNTETGEVRYVKVRVGPRR